MSVRFDQLLSLSELKDLKLVSGFKGISKIVKWVHVVESPEEVVFVHSYELIIVTGVKILNNKGAFIELIKKLVDKKAAGLVLNVGKYIKQVPQYIKKLSDESDFPVFEFPWEHSLAEFTKIICSYILTFEEVSFQDLLMDTIFLNTITYENFVQRISACGYNSLNSYRIIIANMDNIDQYLKAKNIKDGQGILNVSHIFLNVVNSSIWYLSSTPLSFFQNNSVVLLIINEKNGVNDLAAISDSIRENSKKKLGEINVSIGVGDAHTEFCEIKESYEEAKKALKVLKTQGELNKIIFYSDLGAYKILTEIQDIVFLREYYNNTVGKLEKYDEQNHTDLAKIFYVFLNENGNYTQTSQRLFLHRNTLMYKINKIQELLKRDLADTKVRLEFYMGYLIKELNDFKTDSK
ncbi:MAG: hypothetical protein ACI8WT_002309 [Clostridium sp.]|jgi:hypothetical protein